MPCCLYWAQACAEHKLPCAGTQLCCSHHCWATLGHCHGDKMSVGIWSCTDRNKTPMCKHVPQCSLPMGTAVKDGKCVKFYQDLKNQNFGFYSALIWTSPPLQTCYLHIFPLRGHGSYACAEVLPLSFYRPSPVSAENYCESEELLDFVFIATKVLFTLVNKENAKWLQVV